MSEVCEVCLRPRHIAGRWKPDTQCPREFPEGSLAGCLQLGYEREKGRAAHFEALARNLATDESALRSDQPAPTETGPLSALSNYSVESAGPCGDGDGDPGPSSQRRYESDYE